MKLKDGHGPSGSDSRRRALELAGFANAVLKILEFNKRITQTDCSIIAGEISRAAIDWRLAKFDTDGEFIGIDRRDQ